MKRLLSIFILFALLLALCGCNQEPQVLTTVPTTATYKPTPTGPIYDKENYTVTLEELQTSYGTVVAQLGDHQVDLELLQMAYWTEFVDFLYQNNNNLAFFNLDLSLPLHQQTNPGTGGNWQQYFLNAALDTLRNYLVALHAAQQEQIEIPEALNEAVEDELEELTKAAAEEGYTDMDAYVTYLFGPGCTVKAWKTYNYLSRCCEYYQNMCILKFDITDKMVEDYYEANKQDFVNAGMIQDDTFVYEVRHIIAIVDEGAEESAWEEARNKALVWLNTYQTGEKTEESFSKLALDHSEDAESYLSGGLISGLVENSNYPEAFKNWYLDENRQPGDVELVKTELGYHVMYYVGTLPTWRYNAGQSLINTKIAAIIPDAVAKYPVTIYYDKLLVAEVEESTAE